MRNVYNDCTSVVPPSKRDEQPEDEDEEEEEEEEEAEEDFDLTVDVKNLEKVLMKINEDWRNNDPKGHHPNCLLLSAQIELHITNSLAGNCLTASCWLGQ